MYFMSLLKLTVSDKQASCNVLVFGQVCLSNSIGPDQTAPGGAV